MTIRRILKYPLKLVVEQTINLPAGSEILSVIEQDEGLVIYAVVSSYPEDENIIQTTTKDISVLMLGTGNSTIGDLNDYTFLGTVPMRGATFVMHVFYRLKVYRG